MKRIAILLFAALLLVPLSASAASFKVIVNSAANVTSLPKKEISDLFMKRTAKWSNGTPVTPVDQSDRSAVRDEFSKTIHGKPTAAVKSYWQQQIFSGQGLPPPELADDDAVVSYVLSHPGAIGYVTAGTGLNGARTVDVH